ncbi:hypothetical protein K3495_g17198 [Podosphaera aphanis]|nr:hypothetical protein K3495_g17198 [Podosphaera aphanis]
MTITPQRPRANGKFEKANGELKEILNKLVYDQLISSYETLLDQAVSIYNGRVGPNGYTRATKEKTCRQKTNHLPQRWLEYMQYR